MRRKEVNIPNGVPEKKEAIMMDNAFESDDAKPKSSPFYSRLYAAKPHIIVYIIAALLLLGGGIWFIAKNTLNNGVTDTPRTSNEQPQNSNVKGGEFRLKIRVGETGYAFDNQVKITLNKIQIDKSSSKNQVFADVIFPNDEKVGFTHAEVSSKLSYPRDPLFEIEVLDIEDSSAFFLVRKINKPDKQG